MAKEYEQTSFLSEGERILEVGKKISWQQLQRLYHTTCDAAGIPAEDRHPDWDCHTQITLELQPDVLTRAINKTISTQNTRTFNVADPHGVRDIRGEIPSIAATVTGIQNGGFIIGHVEEGYASRIGTVRKGFIFPRASNQVLRPASLAHLLRIKLQSRPTVANDEIINRYLSVHHLLTFTDQDDVLGAGQGAMCRITLGREQLFEALKTSQEQIERFNQLIDLAKLAKRP